VVDQHRLDDVIAALETVTEVTQVTGLSGASQDSFWRCQG
jgi:hypothetical protein